MKLFFTLLSILCCFYSFSQKPVDSLLNKSYNELLKEYHSNRFDNTKEALKNISTYLHKAKKEKDTLKIALAFHWLGRISEAETELKYSDSIISITKNVQNEKYPMVGYATKGYWAYNFGIYNKALDYYLKAFKFTIINYNPDAQKGIKYNIAYLKSICGLYEESNLLYKEELAFIKLQKNYKENNIEDYISVLSNLSSSYLALKKLDSADIYIKKGIKESLRINDTLEYYHFVSTSGYNEYFKRNYKSAIDSLDKAFPFDDDQNSRINYYLYKGKIANDLGQKEKAILNFEKLDSIYEIHKDPVRELPEVYQTFITYYKEKGDTDNQLKYIEKLIAADSVLDANFNYLSTNITKEYDIPLLISEKEGLIERLKNEKRVTNLGLGALGGVSIILVAFLIYYIRKQKVLKKRFEEILNSEPDHKITPQANKKISGVSKEVIAVIQERLTIFETQKEFLDNTITLHTLSKKLDTNSNYLSKVINYYKQKNFSTYLNDLRVEYVIKQLKTSTQFKLYSIKGIAKEVGFNNETSFSKAFYKRTGMYPSYFIKQLEKVKT